MDTPAMDFNQLSQKPAALPSEAPRRMDLLVCQDWYEMKNASRVMVNALNQQGQDIRADIVEHSSFIIDLLENRLKSGQQPPTDILLDVSGGNGADAAISIANWIEKNYPGVALPRINFLSCDLNMGIDEACKLRRIDMRFVDNAGAVDERELYWVSEYLETGKTTKYKTPPLTMTLRHLVEERLGYVLPRDQEYDDYYTPKLKEMSAVTNDSLFQALDHGNISLEQVISRMRTYATGVAESLCSGLYMQDGLNEIHPDTDATFYGAAGYPKKGRVVFTLKDVEAAEGEKEKPILMMKSYDPVVAQLLAEGKISGIVVTYSYMASHLKMLCETHMVPGLFGLMPQKESCLTGAFNEEAKPQDAPFFEGSSVTIAGHTITKGQSILLNPGNNGMVCNPPKSLQTETIDIRKISGNSRLSKDLKSLKKLGECFDAYFKSIGMPVRGVKANIDSGSNRPLLNALSNIGLVRTEQMVATHKDMLSSLKSILFSDAPNAYEALAEASKLHYGPIIRKLDDLQPVKIRLFDFNHAEILTKEEKKRFLAKYPSLDIHGGAALTTWPELYRQQVRCLFQTLDDEAVSGKIPLEIMMPAIRTKEETLEIKKIVDEEARKAGIKPAHYSFGVMVETLECCKNIEEIAPLCDFISFGTNDLTQQYTGVSRSDLKAYARYEERHGYNPYKTLAPEILEMVRDVTARARIANPHLKIDLCGGQAADPQTALKIFEAGIDNISVAPTIGNLYGLPMLLKYLTYDAVQAVKNSYKPAPAQPAAVRMA